MAVGVLVKTVIFDQDLYKPGHMVHTWMTQVVTRFGLYAREAAPKRTGELAASIDTEARQVGPRQDEGTLAVSAPYALFVLRGTVGPIRSTKAQANPAGAYSLLWGSIDPKTKKFTRRQIKGVRREQHMVPNKGYFLRIPGDEVVSKDNILFEVSGQSANNFLIEAYRRTARKHKALRGGIPSGITNP
jgi:hypothetical protein